ncbi:MAG: hypothetical protein LBV79_10300 [Candidatus Adiutrix sp.]|jgi:hypothetical protein|nr:hypothetical protein [Candidatus Adiutrix sp.]
MADIATPINPAIATSGQLQDALYAFVLAYGIPAMDGANIYHANQNRMSLPDGLEEYATIYIMSPVRHGTAVEKLIPGEGEAADRLSITSLFEYLVQIDFFSEDTRARQRAMTVANVGRSSIGPQFFRQYGVSLLYVDDPRDMAFVGDAQQYVQRWMLTLRVTMPEITTVEFPGFEEAEISRLENVDVHHPPTEE